MAFAKEEDEPVLLVIIPLLTILFMIISVIVVNAFKDIFQLIAK